MAPTPVAHTTELPKRGPALKASYLVFKLSINRCYSN